MARVSAVLAPFIFVAIAAGSGVNALSQGQREVYEQLHINRTDYGSRYIDLETRPLSAEVPTSASGRSRSGNNGRQRILTEERNHVSLHTEIADGSDEAVVQRHVTLVIAVPSVRPDRRKAIRETWSKWAGDRVVLRFFTEPPNQGVGGKSAEEIAALLAEESLTYGDIVVQDIGTGMNFGLKILLAMRWMSHHYSFDFFLRLDDDYFLCLERLLEDLDCLLLPGKQPSPIFAGYRICEEKSNAAFVDEAYILLSSSIIDRVLVASDLRCSGYGSLTVTAWIKVGGPGNPRGDVAYVHDYRLDHYGYRWKKSRSAKVARSEYDPICERGLGVHRTYPENMYKLWMEVSNRANATRSTDGCTSLFRYEDDGECPFIAVGDEAFLEEDNVQPCDSFSAQSNKVWCGHQGC